MSAASRVPTPNAADQQALLASAQSLGSPQDWRTPDGYPGLALCIVDSVWSLGANYDRHVTPVLDEYRRLREEAGGDANADTSADLVDVIDRIGGPEGFADRVGNHQRAWRRRTAPLKSAAAFAGAAYLADLGVLTPTDLRAAVGEDPAEEELRRGWRQAVPGQRSSSTGWRYLLILAGLDEVKPDTMVTRWVTATLGRPVSADEARDAVLWLAANYPDQGKVSARALDYRIWRTQSGRPV